MANVALSPPHVCHRQRTGLSSQARTCSKRWSLRWAPPHLGAPLLPWTVHQQKCKTQIATTSRRETMFSARLSTRTSSSPGRPQRANARMKPEVSKLAIIAPQTHMLLAHACETRVPRRAPWPKIYLKSNELEVKDSLARFLVDD